MFDHGEAFAATIAYTIPVVETQPGGKGHRRNAVGFASARARRLDGLMPGRCHLWNILDDFPDIAS